MSETKTSSVTEASGRSRAARAAMTESTAYRGGWRDGRFAPAGEPVEERCPSGLEGDERQAYCSGYHEGQRVRRMLGHT